jgi:hypothetical protein
MPLGNGKSAKKNIKNSKSEQSLPIYNSNVTVTVTYKSCIMLLQTTNAWMNADYVQVNNTTINTKKCPQWQLVMATHLKKF